MGLISYPVGQMETLSYGPFLVLSWQTKCLVFFNIVATFQNESDNFSKPGEVSDAPSKPLYHWSDHGLAITGLAVGPGGLRARVLTVSKDQVSTEFITFALKKRDSLKIIVFQTCKVYSLSSGDLLLDVTFSTPLVSVAIDLWEKNVFVGSVSGAIYTFSLSDPPRDLKLTIEGDKKANMLVGHSQEVSCLSVSSDCQVLGSGSKDNDVRLWHIHSRQCIRIIPHKGQVSTVR